MKRASAAVAAGAALALVAATGPTTAPAAGTASTRLTAIELSVTGVPVPVDGATVLDVTSFASTDRDAARNPAKQPFASIAAVPARVAGQAVGAVEARSDGDGSKSVGSLERAVGPVTAVVNGAELSASAAADSATALLRGATARLSALEALGIAVNEAGIESVVDGDAASAVQGLKVSGLQLELGELLPALDALPLDTVIALARQLSGTLSGALGTAVDAVVTASDTVSGLAADVSAKKAEYEATAAELRTVLGQIAALQSQLATLQQQRISVQNSVDSGTAPTSDVIDAVDGAIGDVNDTIGGLLGASFEAAQVPTASQLLAEIDAAIATIQGALPQLTSDQTALVAQLEALLAELASLAAAAEAALQTLVAAVQDLLALLPDILAAIADADLVDIGAIDIGLTAEATADSAKAVLGCAVDHVAIAGQALAAPDCATPLTEANGALAGALAQVEALLGALPVVGGVVPDVTLEMFADAYEKTGEANGYRTAEAHVTALNLEIPSIDLGAVTDGLLAGLTSAELSALLATVEDTLGQDAADPLFDTLASLASTIDATLATVTASVPAVATVETTVQGLLDGLPGADALAGLTTPGIRLTVDPTSTASFRPGSTAPAPNDPSGEPAPNLPTTGGGLAILGLLSIAGAAGLMRRR